MTEGPALFVLRKEGGEGILLLPSVAQKEIVEKTNQALSGSAIGKRRQTQAETKKVLSKHQGKKKLQPQGLKMEEVAQIGIFGHLFSFVLLSEVICGFPLMAVSSWLLH